MEIGVETGILRFFDAELIPRKCVRRKNAPGQSDGPHRLSELASVIALRRVFVVEPPRAEAFYFLFGIVFTSSPRAMSTFGRRLQMLQT